MAFKFDVHPEALKRCFAVYVVVARGGRETLLYVGKTGDNREGCNPLISRCGNHFSYNRIHSQVRNKIEVHESWRYTYVFDHFDTYCERQIERKSKVDRINEMERWVNVEIQGLIGKKSGITLLNPYRGHGYLDPQERQRRANFRTADSKQIVAGIIAKVEGLLKITTIE